MAVKCLVLRPLAEKTRSPFDDGDGFYMGSVEAYSSSQAGPRELSSASDAVELVLREATDGGPDLRVQLDFTEDGVRVWVREHGKTVGFEATHVGEGVTLKRED